MAEIVKPRSGLDDGISRWRYLCDRLLETSCISRRLGVKFPPPPLVPVGVNGEMSCELSASFTITIFHPFTNVGNDLQASGAEYLPSLSVCMRVWISTLGERQLKDDLFVQ